MGVLRRAALVTTWVVATGCSDPAPDHDYQATIRWTEHGVPHVLADDLPSAAFGQGWAFAKLNGCILADQIVKVRGERSRYFGPGEQDANVDSDFVHRFLRFTEKGAENLAAQPPEVRDMIAAYAAGYNAYIVEHGGDLPCGDEPWLAPIGAEDLMAHYAELATLASARQMQAYIARAQPPGTGQLERDLPDISTLLDGTPGSNGWAIGADRSSTGRGMVVGNPHFPWEGELKLYESHLRVPGELDVYGASLMGVVGILIGFNENVAWTHTVSAGHRFSFYVLRLDPADPTRYEYDGGYRQMESEEIEIEVLGENGELTTRRRTLWRSHYGPIINVPPFVWADQVLTFRDANEDNDELVAQFQAMNLAENMDAFQAAHAEHVGIPWVNTISASADGRAWYADTAATPNLSPTALQAWEESDDFLVRVLAENGFFAFPGHDSLFEWVEESGARDPGLVPYARLPRLERTDFVFNANDSHWLANPAAPLTGFSPLHGATGTPQSPRTRMNAVLLTETGEGTASGADGKFDLAELREAILSNRGMMAELLRDEVVQRCQGQATYPYEGTEVDIGEACQALAAWDGRLDLDSRGALVWRELLADFSYQSLLDAGPVFTQGFDPDDPIHTPRGLTADTDRVLTALAGAVVRLTEAGIPVTATLGEAQFTKKGDQRIPLHGGNSHEGTPNLMVYDVFKTTLAPSMPRDRVIHETSDLTTEGYVVNYGTSFLMAVGFTDDGPEAYTLLSYSQSDDSRSPHYADQTVRYSAKDWKRVPFTEDDIAADPTLQIEHVTGDL